MDDDIFIAHVIEVEGTPILGKRDNQTGDWKDQACIEKPESHTHCLEGKDGTRCLRRPLSQTGSS